MPSENRADEESRALALRGEYGYNEEEIANQFGCSVDIVRAVREALAPRVTALAKIGSELRAELAFLRRELEAHET